MISFEILVVYPKSWDKGDLSNKQRMLAAFLFARAQVCVREMVLMDMVYFTIYSPTNCSSKPDRDYNLEIYCPKN